MRQDLLCQDGIGARDVQARCGHLGCICGRHACGHVPQGARGQLQRPPQDAAVHEDEALRGDGVRPCALQEGTLRLMPGGRPLSRRVAGGQQGEVGHPDAREGARARPCRASPRDIQPQGLPDSVAEMQAAEDGSSLPEGGDILTLIRSGSTARAYGPEPEIGDEVEAEALFCKKDAVIVGEHRTAYSLWHIETYDWLIETGQRSHYPEIPRPASEAE